MFAQDDDHYVASRRKPAEQPDGFGRGGWRGWRSPGGQQPHRAGLSLPQDKENKRTHTKKKKRKTTPPPSFTSTTRAGRGAGLCFQRRAVSKTPFPPIQSKNQSKYQAAKTSLSALPGLTAPNCKLFPCWIIVRLYYFILIIVFVSLGLLLSV